jgi:hypothetical protein
MKVNTQPEFLMAEMTYNELGQLIEKNLYNPTGVIMQSVDYSYNIRGWLNGINTRDNGNDSGDAISQELIYDGAISALQCVPQYNGNISAIKWKNAGSAIFKGYGYSYDAAKRLTKAVYGQYSGSTWTVNNYFSVPFIYYDYNGNITNLRRWGHYGQTYGVLDELTYYYEGNRIIGVNDYVNSYYGFMDNGHYYPAGGTEYFYDENGNMYRDLNKGILSIPYNHVNLPSKIEFENN